MKRRANAHHRETREGRLRTVVGHMIAREQRLAETFRKYGIAPAPETEATLAEVRSILKAASRFLASKPLAQGSLVGEKATLDALDDFIERVEAILESTEFLVALVREKRASHASLALVPCAGSA